MKKNSLNLRRQALSELIEFELFNNGLLSFYEYGTFDNPGLSDLDLIVEISPNFHDIDNFSKESLPSKVKEVMAHASLIGIKNDQIYGLNLWDDIKLRRVRDNKLIQDNFSKLNYIRNIAMFIDFYYERRFRIMKIIKNWKNLKNETRHILGYCKSYAYSLNVFKRFSEDKKTNIAIDLLEKGIQNKRNIWFNSEIQEKEKICIFCLKEIKDFEKSFSDQIDNHINSILYSFGLRSNKSSPTCLSFPNGPVLATTNLRNNEFAKIPKLVIEHFLIYAQQNLKLSKKIRLCFNQSDSLQKIENPSEYTKFLENRIYEAEKWHLFKEESNHKCNLYKFGWFK